MATAGRTICPADIFRWQASSADILGKRFGLR